MRADLGDLDAFLAVARASGFREASRATGLGASTLSEAVRRLESRLGVRLLHRTTQRDTDRDRRAADRPFRAGAWRGGGGLDLIDGWRDRPAGTLRLNVPVSAARLVLPALLPGFLAVFPDIRIEVDADDSFVDVLAAGSDAGIRYDERLEQDMIAVPIGPRVQRFATAASPDYLARHGRPVHPRELLNHACILGRFASGALTNPWEFERDGELVRVEPAGRLVTRVGGGTDLGVEAAIAGVGIVHLFEDWLRPAIASGQLEPVLEDWWQSFSGPFLYYSDRRLLPPPLHAFVEYVKAQSRLGLEQTAAHNAGPGGKQSGKRGRK